MIEFDNPAKPVTWEFNLKIILGRVFYILLFCAGIYNALLESLRLGGISSDNVDTLMLWYGFQEHGWRFIKTWLYTQDNWLLSLWPFHALLYSIFPFTPTLSILSGLGVFLLNVAICGLIANRIGAKKSVWLVPLLLLFSGEFFYSNSGAFYPITHNITHFFGLLALLLSILWIQYRYKLALALVVLAVVMGGLSDPWFLPSYGLALLMAAVIMRNAYLLRAVILSLILNFTYVFGLFHFLSGTSFSLASWQQFTYNLQYIGNNLGRFINFFPSNSSWAGLASLVILLFLTGVITAQLKQRFLPAAGPQFFFLTTAFSLIILTVSFLFYAEPAPRYLLNFFILGILALSAGIELNWGNFSKWMRITLYTVGVMYVISCLSSHVSLWKQPLTLPPNEYDDLQTVLTSHGWTYGYADYGSANVITGLSQNHIRVRPIAFSKENGYMYWDRRKQTSPLWYQPSDIPAGQKQFFVYWHPTPSHRDASLHQRALTQQYGPPIQILPYKEGVIMVWPHSLKVGLKKDILPTWEEQLPTWAVLMLI